MLKKLEEKGPGKKWKNAYLTVKNAKASLTQLRNVNKISETIFGRPSTKFWIH